MTELGCKMSEEQGPNPAGETDGLWACYVGCKEDVSVKRVRWLWWLAYILYGV